MENKEMRSHMEQKRKVRAKLGRKQTAKGEKKEEN